MKVNLQIAGSAPRSGFLNLDPYPLPNVEGVKVADIWNLDEYVDDAEIDELIALDIIDYIQSPDVERVLVNWIRKIRHGGTIVVGGLDIREVARALVKQDLGLEQANELIFGKQNFPYEHRKCALTLQKLIEKFQSMGFKIIQKRVNDYFYHIKAERP